MPKIKDTYVIGMLTNRPGSRFWLSSYDADCIGWTDKLCNALHLTKRESEMMLLCVFKNNPGVYASLLLEEVWRNV